MLNIINRMVQTRYWKLVSYMINELSALQMFKLVIDFKLFM